MVNEPTRNWARIDRVGEYNHHFLEPDDYCYHLMTRVPGGFSASKVNSDIDNFKKDLTTKGTPQWNYKIDAIRRFADDIKPRLRLHNEPGMVAIPMPTSLPKANPLHDNRLVRVLALAQRSIPDLQIWDAFDVLPTMYSVSKEGGSRSPDSLVQHMLFEGHEDMWPSSILLIDDVITTGGHYKACEKLIRDRFGQIEICGYFWARQMGLDHYLLERITSGYKGGTE